MINIIETKPEYVEPVPSEENSVPKFQIGEFAIITTNAAYIRKNKPYCVQDVYWYEGGEGCKSLWRYRVTDLWFDSEELQRVTKEEDPEWFL